MNNRTIRRSSLRILLLLFVCQDAQALAATCKSNDDCLHGGSCVQLDETTQFDETECICTAGYTGPYCETPMVASATNCIRDSDCLNGGICLLDATGINGVCDCPSGHYGYHCQERCPCLNGGTCQTDYSTGLYECQCTEEFYDPLCMSRWDGEGGRTNRAQSMLITLLAITLGLFFCLIYLASSNGGDGESTKIGNPGIVRTADGKIMYSDGDEETEQELEAQTDQASSVAMEEDTEPDLTDLELT